MAGAIGPARITLRPPTSRSALVQTNGWLPIDSRRRTDHYCGTDNHNHRCLYIARLLPFVPKEKMERISNLHYAPVVQASVGFRDTGALRFDAFGGLVPSCEKKRRTRNSFPLRLFYRTGSGRGCSLLVLYRRRKACRPDDLAGRGAESAHQHELHTMLKFPEETEPDMIRIFRHKHAIPQYEQSSAPASKRSTNCKRATPASRWPETSKAVSAWPTVSARLQKLRIN